MTKNILNIQEASVAQSTDKQNSITLTNMFEHVIFDLPFRAYFLLAAAFSMTSLIVWLAFLNGLLNFNTEGLTPVVWHIHEMIFAFAATVAVAFILTAAQTWTGKRSLHGKTLALLIVIWLAARAALIINTEYSVYSALILQGIWWFSVIFVYTKLVISSHNRRNYIFIPILFFMASLNLLILLADLSGNTDIALHLSRSMILVFVLLMATVGGRVIPFFTVRGANTEAINTPKWVSLLLVTASVLGLIIFILSGFIELPLKPSVFMISAGVLHFIRLLYWRTLKTLFIPLLWSLHISYLFISIGLLMLGLSYYQVGIEFSNALHLITIGAISLMIISMMSRVSLGHTGRALTIKKITTFSFFLMVIAALTRSFLPYLNVESIQRLQDGFNNLILFSWNISALLWVLAMFIFLITYWPILTSAKK